MPTSVRGYAALSADADLSPFEFAGNTHTNAGITAGDQGALTAGFIKNWSLTNVFFCNDVEISLGIIKSPHQRI